MVACCQSLTSLLDWPIRQSHKNLLWCLPLNEELSTRSRFRFGSVLPALLDVAKLQDFQQVPNPKPYATNPYLFPGCRSSSSLYANNSLSVAASALWRLPLVYLVLNFIRIAAIMGKQLLSNFSAHFSAIFQKLFNRFSANIDQFCSKCRICLQHVPLPNLPSAPGVQLHHDCCNLERATLDITTIGFAGLILCMQHKSAPSR